MRILCSVSVGTYKVSYRCLQFRMSGSEKDLIQLDVLVSVAHAFLVAHTHYYGTSKTRLGCPSLHLFPLKLLLNILNRQDNF